MIKVKRNRLKIFESLAPDCEEQSFINYQSHKKLTEGLSKVNLNSCILNEKLVETGSNSLLITLPYQITEEIVYSICSFYGEISYIKTTISESETKKFTRYYYFESVFRSAFMMLDLQYFVIKN